MGKSKEPIYLIGFMGCGKSTIGRALAKRLGVNCLEMDEILVKRAGKPIAKIFEEDGEEVFRRMESELLCETAGQAAVVSCGGGVALRTENAERMRQNGIVFLLAATPQTIYERVKKHTGRPLLNGHMNVEYIAQLMEKRAPFYEAAAEITVRVDGRGIEEIVDEIVDVLAARPQSL
ncbi:MAG: shikimate kinase [Lachnospiraceae bacterium]|nr:shikimate kinase [Lachnospiraceae bacterium]